MEKANRVSINLILPLVFILTPLGTIGIDIYLPSLPAISNVFHTSHFVVKSSVFLYLLGAGLGQFLIAPYVDKYGHKNIIAVALVVFISTSFLITVTKSLSLFLCMRILQGMCTVVVAISRILVASLFKGKKLKVITSYMVIAWSIGPIIAPVLGGYFQEYMSWKVSYYFLAVYGGLALILLVFIKDNFKKKKVNYKQIYSNYFLLARNIKFMAIVFSMVLVYSIIIIFAIMSPYIIQVNMKYNSIFYGHMALLLGVACMFGGFIARLLIKHMSAIYIVKIALGIFSFTGIALLISYAIFHCFNIFTFMIPSIILIMAVGMAYPMLSSMYMELFPSNKAIAGALCGIMLLIGTATMGSIVSLVYRDYMFYYSVFICLVSFILVFIIYNFFEENPMGIDRLNELSREPK